MQEAVTMLDYEETIDKFRKGDLEIDCRKMRLTQCKTDGEMYIGKGYIRQTEGGGLEFKLYVVETSNVKPFDSLNRRLSIEAGSLNPEDVFYDLSATAHDGTLWAAEKLLPEFSWDMTDIEVIAHGTILSMYSKRPVENLSPFLELHFFDDLDVPLTMMSDTEVWGQKYRARNKAEFAGLDGTWIVRKRDKRVIIEFQKTTRPILPNFEYRVQEALQFLAARPAFWRARLASVDDAVVFELMSPWRRSVRTQMGAPIAPNNISYFHDGWRLFMLYLEYLVTHTKDTQWNPVAYHFYTASETSANSIDAWAVGFCVALEAVISLVTFEDDEHKRRRTEEFQERLSEIITGKLEQYPEFLLRLDGMISGLTNERVQDKLHALAEMGHVTREYIKSWTKLRNRQVHPKSVDLRKPDSAYMQETLDLIHQVEVLLHQVIFHLIGYEGMFTDYGARQFPLRQYPLIPQAGTMEGQKR